MTNTESTRTAAEWEHLERSYDAAYLARRAARLASAKARKEPLGSSRTDDKATRAPEPKLAALALPRATSGLLSGIHGKLSTQPKRSVRIVRDASGRLRAIMPAPKPTPDNAPTGRHICAPQAPMSASHASVQAEALNARMAERAETRMDPRLHKYTAREDALK